ncbi:hypothetical protein G6F48_006912 [Rhizopus delemar]|nr:hypothetical protein G6F48_006912 [Rhizopus delemar]
MRVNYEFSPGTMKISEVLLQESSSFESSEEEGNVNNLMKTVTFLFNPRLKSFLLLTPVKLNTYCSYNTNQVGSFLLLPTKQVPVRSAAADAGISLSLAFRLIKLWEEEGTILPSKKRGLSKGIVANIKQQHTQFVVAIVDSYASVTLDQMRHRLLIEFPTHRSVFPLTMQVLISTSTVFEVSPKKVSLSSIFPTSRGTLIEIFEAICTRRINISLKKTITIVGSKKRKAGGTAVAATARTGTRMGYFLGYLQYVISSLNKNNLKGNYVVMGSSYS